MTESVSTQQRAFTRVHTALAVIAIAASAAIAIYFGWREFWFITDDAFISFRYASNSLHGRGYVWNPAPFAPVEGYTSFLWVVLLRYVWSLLGVEPPAAANWIALGFGYATVFMGALLIWRMELPRRFARVRLVWLALVLLGTISNRTFLTWLSSGLETSLFNFAVTYWIWSGMRAQAPAPRYFAHVAAASALLALTRPDGLLFCAAALALIVHRVAARGWDGRPRAGLLALTPLLLVPAHLAFRRSTYGAWLPNTYYAKHVASWPESGIRYLASFVVEYAVWVWACAALAVGAWTIARMLRGSSPLSSVSLPHAVVALAVAAHVAYYTFIIGGDHFEYRVYSHLPLLLSMSLVWLLARLADRPGVAAAGLCLFIVCSWPIPWLHWQRSKGVAAEDFEHLLRTPLAAHVPAVLGPIVARYDAWQDWLIGRSVCIRQHEHDLFARRMKRSLPTREIGARIAFGDRPVAARLSVGIVGWVLPNVAIIDRLGLNDRVVARSPHAKQRFMAHDRVAPRGYVECYRPNVKATNGRVSVTKRERPLTDEEIRACDSPARWLSEGAHGIGAVRANQAPGSAIASTTQRCRSLRHCTYVTLPSSSPRGTNLPLPTNVQDASRLWSAY